MIPPKVPKIFWVVIIIAFIINALTIVIALNSASKYSYPKIQVTTQKNDDNELKTTIHNEVTSQIEALPQPTAPTNGVDGKNGAAGKDGAQGIPGKPGEPGAKGDTGEKGEVGAQGPPGANARAVELRYNTAKSQIEWRFEGDFGWKLLVTDCTLMNSCLLL